jgi:hypothetical protein
VCAGIAAIVIVAAATPACTDLFHPTEDIRSACEIDAAQPGCGFCPRTSAEAKEQAARVCAWLGACEGPLGGNAFGPCTLQARLAFDCAANPSHPVQGALRDRWACLAAAQTCDDVHRCVLSPSIDCEVAGDTVQCVGPNSGQRVECFGPDASPFVEDCTLWGQGCTSVGAGAVCGPSGPAIDCASAQSTCGSPSATLHVCAPDGGAQSGIDCAGNGAQNCAAFPPGPDPRWVACLPTPAPGNVCDASLAVTCAGGVAQICPTGVAESIDCATWLDAPDACAPGTLRSGADWTSGCGLGPPCPPDSCSGSVLTGCARGTVLSVNCTAVGLGACSMRTTDQDAALHAVCGPP